jgi:hypothetical protein
MMPLPVLLGSCSQRIQDDRGTKAVSKAESPEKQKARVFAKRPARVSAVDGIKLFTEPNSSSVEIKILPGGAIVWVLDEAGEAAAGHWYRLKTRSGRDGWSQGPVQFCSVQASEHEIAMDREALEDRLRDMILDAAAKELKVRNPHPLSSLVSKTITSPLTPGNDASNSYSVNVACLMKGSILGRNKSRLDLKVDLFLEIDRDLLASSDARIKAVAIIDDKATEQMPIVEQITLLKFIAPLL